MSFLEQHFDSYFRVCSLQDKETRKRVMIIGDLDEINLVNSDDSDSPTNFTNSISSEDGKSDTMSKLIYR